MGNEENENKKQNLEDKSFGATDKNSDLIGATSTVKLPVEPTTNEIEKQGERESGARKEDNTLDDLSDLKKIREDVKRLKAIARSQRDEIREGISALTNKLGEMFIAHAATATSANFYGDYMEELSAKLADAELREKDRDKRLDDIVIAARKNTAVVNELEKDVKENTQARKSGNLVLNGVPEKENENCIDVATTYLQHIDPNFCKNQLANAYRLGKKGGSTGKYRTLLVKLKDPAVKEALVKKKTVLKNKKELSKFHCNDDLAQSTRKVRQEMREIAKFALKNGYTSAKASGNKLVIEDKTYYEDELYLLPPDLQLANIKTRPIRGGIGFQSEYSYLSNFFPCSIRMHQNVFVSAEQAYQYHKSIICEREDAGIAIKEMVKPSTIKAKGDKVPTCENWEKVKVAVMRNILLQKFTQHPELKAKLLGTSGSALLECTSNKFWGTGWFFDDPMWDSSEVYPGKNMLGTLLEGIRDGFDIDILNSSAAIADIHQPMEIGGNAIRNPPQLDDADALLKTPAVVQATKKPPQLAEGLVSVTSIKSHVKNAPTAKELSKSIVPTSLDNLPENKAKGVGSELLLSATTPAEPHSDKEGSMESEEIAEPDNYDALSFTSSIFSDGNESFDARNVTLPNGRLNVEKLMGWSLPTVNLSRVLERSVCKSPTTRNRIQKLIDAQESRRNPQHSTPALVNISTICPKGRKSRAATGTALGYAENMSVKESIRKMLEETNS